MKSECRFKYKHLVLPIAAALILSTSACVRIEIGDDKTEASIGQQLTDLLEARQAGAVSESEFRAARKKLLAID